MPLKKIIVNSALDAIKGLSKLREEFAVIAAERNAYEAAVKNLYTKDMPSFDQWKALQAIPAQAPGPLAKIAKTTKPRSSKNKGLEEIPFRTDGSIDLSAVSKDQLLLLDNMARNDPSLIFRATPELGIKPRDSGAEGLFAGRTATGVAPYGDGTNFLGGDNPSLHILRLNSPHSSFSQYDLARSSRSTYSDPSAILNDLQYGLRNGFDQRRLYEFMNDEGLPISKAQIERILLDKGLRFRNNPNAIDEALKGEIGLFDPRDGLETPALQLLGPKMEPQKITYRDGGQVSSGAAFGIYPKQRATPSSKETKDAMTKAAKFAAETLVPQTPFDAGLMLIPGGRVARKAGAALMALDAGDAEAGGLSALMRLLSKEAPAQARQIREALGRAYTSNVEHSVVGSADKGPAGSIVSGTYDSVAPNQLDIARALKNSGSIVDFHTHPVVGQQAFDVSPSLDDFKFSSNEYFPGKQNRELRTIIASPADPGSRSPSAYSFFATDDPSKVFSARNLKDAAFELQKAGRKGTFKSVLDDLRFREYFDYGGSMGELVENIAPLSLFDLRKAQGLGRGEVVLSGRPLSQNSESTNTELFKIMNPSAVELLTRKGFAKGGAVHMDEGGAAFGVFPQMQPRRARQDREAAANAPLSALRGWAAGTAGLPGDIEGLLRMLVPGVSNEPALPTSEFYKEWLPGRSLNETPTGRAFTEAGGLTGGAGLGSLSRAAATGVRAGGRGALSALEAAARNAAVPRTLNPQAGVIKMKGGNRLSGSVEDSLKGLKSGRPTHRDEALMLGGRWVNDADLPEVQQMMAQEGALNNWIDKKLASYVKNEMATPEDPIRALAEKWAVDKPAKLAEAQARIDALASKIEQTAGQRGVPPEYLTSMRQQMIGLEKEKDLLQLREGLHVDPTTIHGGRSLVHPSGEVFDKLGRSEAAKNWENASDRFIAPMDARVFLHTRNGETGIPTVERNPWLAKVPPETPVYDLYPHGSPDDLGFNHLIDELRNATNPDSGLPKELLLKYQDLPKITLPQAVDRVADINAWRAAQKVEADMARANNAATFLHKEYPEQGMKWVELKTPTTVSDKYKGTMYEDMPEYLAENRKFLEDALKYEGDTMQHCVGGYCPDVAEGRSRIFSLRDAKGQPQVTVETQPVRGSELGRMMADLSDEEAPLMLKNPPQRIVQIKGKGNKAPNEDVLPFVQDFVKSGKWSDVGDLGNAGLQRADWQADTLEELNKFGIEAPTYGTAEEINKTINALNKAKGFAQGGLVQYDAAKIDALTQQLQEELYAA